MRIDCELFKTDRGQMTRTERYNYVRELRAEGLSYEKIGERLGVTRARAHTLMWQGELYFKHQHLVHGP